METFIAVLIVLFLAALLRSTLGFGDALLGMPILALLIGVQIATPLVALGASTIALTILASSWRQVDLRLTWRLILSTLLGIPLGLWLLHFAPEAWVMRILGLLLVLFGLYNLFLPPLPSLMSRQWAFVFGFIAGILGGAYNTNGPPIVIYGALRNWPPERFRSTLQSYFFPTGLLILAGHALAGLWTRQVWLYYLAALPLILLAVFLGGRLNRRISPAPFQRLVYATLVVFGVMLVVR